MEDFKEVWFVDFEFRAPDGENPEPVYGCIWTSLKNPEADLAQGVRVVSLQSIWGVSPFMSPTTHLGDAATFPGLVLPENLLDLFVEFRVHMNGFAPGASVFWGDVASDCRIWPLHQGFHEDLAMREGHTADEKEALMDWGDVRSLVCSLEDVSPIDLEGHSSGRYMSLAPGLRKRDPYRHRPLQG